MQQKSILLVTKVSEARSCSQQVIPIASLMLTLAWMWQCDETDKEFNPVANKLFWLGEFPVKAVLHPA